MPWKAKPPCRIAACPNLQPCPQHPPQGRWEGRGSSAARGYGYAWQQLRTQVLARDGFRCACGAPATQVDHVVPKVQGGTDHPGNLASRCNACANTKTGREGQARR
jgi:5-methylcytosine-specific restriction protein A